MDVDIDCNSGFDPLKVFERGVRASVFREHKLTPHPCGVYFQDVPIDPITNLAAAPYDVAEILGCFKIDFLHLHVYDHFTSRDEIKELLKHDPDWKLLQVPSVVAQLFQLAKHYDVIDKVKPTSIIEIADVLALIRPQKRFMLDKYIQDPKKIRIFLYSDDGEGYAFKKAHAIAYAMVIILQLHLIKGGIKF